jgi:hypothetical protein
LTIILVLFMGEILELLSWRLVHPEESLLLGVLSVPCHEDAFDYFCPFLIPRWLQGDCKWNDLEQTQIQNGLLLCFLMLSFLPYFGVQVRSQCFSAKVVKVPLIILYI